MRGFQPFATLKYHGQVIPFISFDEDVPFWLTVPLLQNNDILYTIEIKVEYHPEPNQLKFKDIFPISLQFTAQMPSNIKLQTMKVFLKHKNMQSDIYLNEYNEVMFLKQFATYEEWIGFEDLLLSKAINRKECMLMMMLELNEDFDEDLLQDAIQMIDYD